MKEDHNKLYKKRQQEMALRINELTSLEETWFWEMTVRQLRWYVYRFSQDPEDMDEMVAITIDKIIKAKDKYDPSKSLFTSWAHRIAHNEALNFVYLKNKDLKRSIKIDADGEFLQLKIDDVDSEAVEFNGVVNWIIEAIPECLTEVEQKIAEELWLGRKKQPDLAEELQMNLNTLKTYNVRMKNKVRNHIFKKYPLQKEAILDLL